MYSGFRVVSVGCRCLAGDCPGLPKGFYIFPFWVCHGCDALGYSTREVHGWLWVGFRVQDSRLEETFSTVFREHRRRHSRF